VFRCTRAMVGSRYQTTNRDFPERNDVMNDIPQGVLEPKLRQVITDIEGIEHMTLGAAMRANDVSVKDIVDNSYAFTIMLDELEWDEASMLLQLVNLWKATGFDAVQGVGGTSPSTRS